MSPSIWTRCAGTAEIAALHARPWRVVEAQHLVATRKLVDSDAEHALLEELIERGKPPLPPGPAFGGLHYLLATPFRYPPLRHGSRFGSRFERGIWYGAVARRTAFAEAAYYRLLFLEGTAAPLAPLLLDLSLFQAAVATPRGVDLTAGPFAAERAAIASPSDYGPTQRLGTEMRAAGVAAFRYPSARDPRGVGVGVLTPAAFVRPHPSSPQTWYCVATREAVEVSKKDVFRRTTYRFARARFEVGGQLPSPAT